MLRPIRRSTNWLVLFSLVVLLGAGPRPARGEEGQTDPLSAAQLLPDSTVIYLEIPQPKQVIEQLLEHPVTKSIQQSEQYQQAMQNQKLVPLMAGIAAVEFGMQQTWQQVLAKVSAGGIVLAIDAKTQGFAWLVQAEDQSHLEKLRNVIVNLARDSAKGEQRDDPVKLVDYRGVQAYGVGDAKYATLGRWLLVTNKDELGKQIIDRYLDRPQQHLAANAQFQSLLSEREPSLAIWGFADLERIRSAIAQAPNGDQNPLVSGKAKDPGGEVIVGGLLANLQHAPYAQAAVSLTNESLKLSLSSPHDPKWVGEEREYYFGPAGEGHAPPPLELPGTVLTLSTYRNLSEMWLRAGDLFNQQVNDKFAEADATLATLFSGRDFGEEVLGAIRPELQLVVARQTFADGQPTPALKLPSFALIVRLKEPETMQQEFRTLFQNLFGFLNIVGAMNGQPQTDQDIQRQGEVELVTATYRPERDRPPGAEAKIQYNFSPSLAFIRDYMIVSSTTALASDVAQHLANPPAEQPQTPRSNTYIRVDPAVLHTILQDNQRQLVAQNVLEEGHTQEEAEAEIKGLLGLVELLRQVELQLQADSRLQLDVRMDWNVLP